MKQQWSARGVLANARRCALSLFAAGRASDAAAAGGLLLALSMPVPGALAADAYPSKPIRLVVPFAAGSATDTMGRMLAHELSGRLGQNVIVENRAGANGLIAAAAVARSAPDGYTLFMTTNSTHGANSHLYRKLPYDPIADFVPVVRTGTLPFMLVVTPALPVASTRELIAHAKAHPGTLAYGTASTTSLVGAETINRLAGIDMLQVGYKASPQALLDLTAGRFQVMVADFATAMPHVKAGNLRVLAVTTAKRSALLPDVPAIADSLPGFDLTSWNGVFAPTGTPAQIVARVERETLAALAQPALRNKLATIGFEVDPMDAKRFGAYVREQIEYWGKLVHAANIQPE